MDIGRRKWIVQFTAIVWIATSFRVFAAEPPAVIDIITLGDSITKGVRTGVLAEDTFAAGLERTLKERGFSVRVANLGIGGERTDQALTRLEKDVLSRKPQVVTIMYGTNDSYVDKGQTDSRITAEAYRKNLVALVQKLQAAGIRPVLMTEPRWGEKATFNGAGEHPNERLERYMAECRAAATALKVPLVDHYAHWAKAEAAGHSLGDWTTDQCHPNPAGHRVLLETMLPVIEKQVRELRQP